MTPLPDQSRPLAEQPIAVLLAMLLFGEARGQSYRAKLAVGSVVRNRVQLNSPEFGHDWVSVITRPYAFSCLLANDPNHDKLWNPVAHESQDVWDECWHAACETLANTVDHSFGAVFYFSRPIESPPHVWGQVEFSAEVDQLHFYRRVSR